MHLIHRPLSGDYANISSQYKFISSILSGLLFEGRCLSGLSFVFGSSGLGQKSGIARAYLYLKFHTQIVSSGLILKIVVVMRREGDAFFTLSQPEEPNLSL